MPRRSNDRSPTPEEQASTTTEKIAFFGDSLSDDGEFWSVSEQLLVDPLPDPAYYAQKFSNGEVHTQVLTRLLGYEGADSISGVDYNYAVGGARAVGEQTAQEFVRPGLEFLPDADLSLLDTRIDLSAQVDRFLADAAAYGWDLSTFTAHILIGANDLTNWEPDSIWPWDWDNEIGDLVKDIVASIELNIEELLAAGVETVRVATQPKETFFPVYNQFDLLMELLSDGVINNLNKKLVSMVASFDDERIEILDINEIADEIEADPLNFGRIDIEHPILGGTGGDYDPPLRSNLPADFDFASDANDYGFLDDLHPTEGTHRIIGIFEAEAIESNLINGGGGSNTLIGTDADDLVLAGKGSDKVSLERGDDVAIGGRGSDTVTGDAGSDLISGGAGDDTLRGGKGNDLLTGGYDDDRVYGGAGKDLIVDTAGSDTLVGGANNDFFLWFDGVLAGAEQGPDTIDGNSGHDTLILYIADSETYEAALADYGDGKGTEFDLASLDITVSRVETIEFVDLSSEPLELPDTGDAELAARIDEWLLWDFA